MDAVFDRINHTFSSSGQEYLYYILHVVDHVRANGEKMETPILRAENLTHTYGISTPFEKTAVNNINLNVRMIDCVGYVVPEAKGYILEEGARGSRHLGARFCYHKVVKAYIGALDVTHHTAH